MQTPDPTPESLIGVLPENISSNKYFFFEDPLALLLMLRTSENQETQVLAQVVHFGVLDLKV